jgi:hypothetical protein
VKQQTLTSLGVKFVAETKIENNFAYKALACILGITTLSLQQLQL